VAKQTTHYVCDECGDSFPRWTGRCESCGAWSSLKEFRESKAQQKTAKGRSLELSSLKDVSQQGPTRRLSCGIVEVDEVLGGGIVPGSVALMAGQPGIGKSTLLTQLAASISAQEKVIYVSGEESISQISLRAKRLIGDTGKLSLAASTSTDDTVATIASGVASVVVIDSIQTMQLQSVDSNPGSVSQIAQSSHAIIDAAKRSNTAVLIVGHVTKDGNIAGPKILEHIVDVVLQLEGDRYGGFKTLRSVKNRYGSTNNMAIFEMKDSGMEIVDNPSKAMLAERQVADGSVVLATMEGARPMLVEVQALVNRTNFGYPKRTASGFDLNRLNLLSAVLDRRTKLDLSDQDIYINIVGGVRINEPAADLAVAMAIASAAKSVTLADDAVVFGEVGLSGELRHVPNIDKRIAEAKKLGFKKVVGPQVSNIDSKIYQPYRDLRSAMNSLVTEQSA